MDPNSYLMRIEKERQLPLKKSIITIMPIKNDWFTAHCKTMKQPFNKTAGEKICIKNQQITNWRQ
ncbi:CLUMA_CG000319, isoform A [Clunio marinus]|uniref:CLUMA_CG000319, isoform A n=1 Tax=Clunio marinus TaxID=568069 RepID=A0A1J1HEX7_9DIPT|nr:CLUMA_CG000319, isoform A [Clunio marinus]